MSAPRTFTRRQLLASSAGLAALALVPAVATPPGAGATVDLYVVTSNGLRLRSGPGTGYGVLASLPSGTGVEILAWKGWANGYEWAQVWVSSLNRTGYVATQYLTPRSSTGEFYVGSAATTTASVNLRTGAGTAASVIAVLPAGTHLGILEGPVAANGYAWYRVRTASDARGWVAGAFLKGGAPSEWDQYATFHVIVDRLNLRREPSLSAAVIEVLPRGAVLTKNGDPEDHEGYTWHPVTASSGNSGWVVARYIA